MNYIVIVGVATFGAFMAGAYGGMKWAKDKILSDFSTGVRHGRMECLGRLTDEYGYTIHNRTQQEIVMGLKKEESDV